MRSAVRASMTKACARRRGVLGRPSVRSERLECIVGLFVFRIWSMFAEPVLDLDNFFPSSKEQPQKEH